METMTIGDIPLKNIQVVYNKTKMPAIIAIIDCILGIPRVVEVTITEHGLKVAGLAGVDWTAIMAAKNKICPPVSKTEEQSSRRQ